MERLTKIVVLAWTCAALALEVWLLSSSWPHLILQASVLMVVAVGLGIYRRKTIAVVLACGYVFPALVSLWHFGPHYAPHEGLWMVALVGVMLPDAIGSGWNSPRAWRPILLAAALVIVVASPIVFLREIDFNPGLLTDMRGWSYGGAVWPSIGVTWVLHTSLTLVVGLLWFDWLSGARDLDFQKFVLTPLAVSCFVLAAVSMYQLLFNLSFLNETVFASIGRAAGTMYDANVSGMIAALWIGGSFLWARRFRPHIPAVAGVAVLTNWLAVWASGSRTAFAAAVMVTIGIGLSLAKERAIARKQLLWAAGFLVAAVVVVVGVTAVVNPRIVGPLGRVRATLPGASVASIEAFVSEMWNRNGYGTAATAIIRQEPLFGIGVGTFHTMAGDYLPGGLPPDNAQNWLRHQVVELGALGSLAWILWFVVFGGFVLRQRLTDPPAAWVTRSVLVAFAATSMLGMPGQDVMVAVTFWTLAFWHVLLVGQPSETRQTSRWAWIAVAGLVVAVGVGTADLALTRLRVPVRALNQTWPFSYGFANAETTGPEAGYRSTKGYAVAVLDPPYRWLVVSVRLDDRETTQPVDVRVWTNGAVLLKGRLDGATPLTAFMVLPVEPGEPGPHGRILLEAASRRADSRRPFFVRGEESLLLLKWEFLDRPPAGFNGYSHPISS